MVDVVKMTGFMGQVNLVKKTLCSCDLCRQKYEFEGCGQYSKSFGFSGCHQCGRNDAINVCGQCGQNDGLVLVVNVESCGKCSQNGEVSCYGQYGKLWF